MDIKTRAVRNLRRFAASAVHLLALAGLTGCVPDQPAADKPFAPLVIASPAGAGSTVPNLAPSSEGGVVLSWVSATADGGHVLQFSTLHGQVWQHPQTVARGSGWFVNWADVPSVAPVSSNFWAAHWLAAGNDNPFGYDVYLALSDDAGKTWGNAILLHDDHTATEHGFASLTGFNGNLMVVWLDGRDYAVGIEAGPSSRILGVAARAASIDPDGRKLSELVVDTLVCDCCQTDLAATRDALVLVYRDRSKSEVRDPVVRRYRAGQWSKGVRLGPDNWEIHGCPVNGPAIAAHDDMVAAAWFTGVNNTPRVRASLSIDGGATFLPAIDIDSQQNAGRVDVEIVDKRRAVVSWVRDNAQGGADLVLRTVDTRGQLGPIQPVSRLGSASPAGSPKMLRDDARLVFAWLDGANGKNRLQTALVAITSLDAPH